MFILDLQSYFKKYPLLRYLTLIPAIYIIMGISVLLTELLVLVCTILHNMSYFIIIFNKFMQKLINKYFQFKIKRWADSSLNSKLIFNLLKAKILNEFIN